MSLNWHEPTKHAFFSVFQNEHRIENIGPIKLKGSSNSCNLFHNYVNSMSWAYLAMFVLLIYLFFCICSVQPHYAPIFLSLFFSTKNIPYLYKLEWFLQKKEKEMAMTNRQIENNAVHEYSTARERAASERESVSKSSRTSSCVEPGYIKSAAIINWRYLNIIDVIGKHVNAAKPLNESLFRLSP